MGEHAGRAATGPFLAAHLHSGDPYELSHGRPVQCAPAGGSGAGPNALGASVVGWDPAVEEVGVDAGYSPEPDMLRAPDVAVGNVPNKPGWIQGAPRLAIEYADIGQDEEKLQEKIVDLLDAGTEVLWVVRLTGPRRVEVHRPGRAMETVLPGSHLTAPGILRNPVLVEALYDRTAARKASLTNLLQGEGYADLDAMLRDRQERGRIDHAGTILRRVLAKRGWDTPPEIEARIAACTELATLDDWHDRAIDAKSLADVFKS